MAVTFRSVASGTSTTSTLSIDCPAGAQDNDILLAFVKSSLSYSIGSPVAPAGWTRIVNVGVGSTAAVRVFWKRAASEGASYTFTARNATQFQGCILAYSGCVATGSPINGTIDPTNYIVSNSTIRAASCTTVETNAKLVFLAWAHYLESLGVTPPTDFTERLQTESGQLIYAADYTLAAIGASGVKNATANIAPFVKYAVLIPLMEPAKRPSVPVITLPETGFGASAGTYISLQCRGTDPEAQQVCYRWRYSLNGAADVMLFDTNYVASGTQVTGYWITTGFPDGTYAVKAWTVDSDGYESALYDTTVVYIANTVIDSPTDESSVVVGEIDLVGRGYLSTASGVYIQWQLDTVNPPSGISGDFQSVTSGFGPQKTPLTTTATIPSLGTWYIRARTLDESLSPTAWTSVRTVYALEALRLDAGSQVELSVSGVANRVYVKASKAAVEETATNWDTAPTYDDSPREVFVVAPEDADSAACLQLATTQLALRSAERVNISGLRVKLADGLKLQRGKRIGVRIDRMDINSVYPIRELHYDIAGDICEITVGEFHEPRTDQDALLAIAQKLQQLQKESATS